MLQEQKTNQHASENLKWLLTLETELERRQMNAWILEHDEYTPNFYVIA